MKLSLIAKAILDYYRKHIAWYMNQSSQAKLNAANRAQARAERLLVDNPKWDGVFMRAHWATTRYVPKR